MLTTVWLIARIAVFRADPQQLPSSLWLPLVMAAACLAASLRPGSDPAFAALLAIAQLLVMAALVVYALRRRGVGERAGQTLSALFGALAVVNLAARPVLSWIDSGAGPAPWLPVITGTLLLLWMVAVMAHILHQALDTTPSVAALLSVLMLGIALVSTIVLLSLRAWMLDR